MAVSVPASACAQGTAGAHGPDRITRTLYTAAGRVSRVRSGVGTALERDGTVLGYTPNGQLSSLIDGENNLTFYAYDGHDRLSSTHYPVAAKGALTPSQTDHEQLGYDPGGNVIWRRLRDGQMIGVDYDAADRPTYKNLPGTEPDVTYSYDLLGQLTQAIDANGHFTQFGHDALGRVTSEASLYGGTIVSQYDLAGRRTRITHPDGFFASYEHLVTGEVAAIRESGTNLLASFEYDDLGRRTRLIRGNLTEAVYGYDPASRLTSLLNDTGQPATIELATFTHNPAGQIASRTGSNPAYSWTGHGNGTVTSTANGLNQLASQGAATPTYDLRGNMTSDGLGRTFGYDSDNKLVSATGAAGPLYHDPLGRLSFIQDPAGSEVRAYSGYEVIAETTPAGVVLRRYVHGPGVDEPLVWYEGPGTNDKRYLHADERGSIITVTNQSATVLGINTYDEYGKPAPTNLGRFQYTGQIWMGEIGLYDYKARMYDPTGGRFVQPDPIGYGDGPNVYSGMGGDPVNVSDPSGTCGELWVRTVQRWNVATQSYGPREIVGFFIMPNSSCDRATAGTGEGSSGGVGATDEEAIVVTGTRRHPAQPANPAEFLILAGQQGKGGPQTEYEGLSDSDLDDLEDKARRNKDKKTLKRIQMHRKYQDQKHRGNERGGGKFRFWPFLFLDIWLFQNCSIPGNAGDCTIA